MVLNVKSVKMGTDVTYHSSHKEIVKLSNLQTICLENFISTLRKKNVK